MATLKTFAMNVRAARKAQRLTQDELAALLNLHPNTVKGIEAGRNGIPLAKLPAFCEALGKSPNELLGYKPQ